MTTAAIIAGLLFIALGAFYVLGRNKIEKNDLKQDVATGKKTNEILEQQRDNGINSVDDADSMWNARKDH